MKKFAFFIAAALCLPTAAPAGEILTGSVPGSITYQGRLERDNAPITGPVHLYFRLYNSDTATGGACGGGQPCLWESPERIVQAVQGIFSADLTPPIEAFAGGQTLYLEVQVEGDTLHPREPLNSVAYALVAKKLEDGSSVDVTTLTAAYQVYLASAAGSSVGVGGTIRPGVKLTVDGNIEMINNGVLRFPDGSSLVTANIGTVAGGITSPADATTIADSNGDGLGNILFGISTLAGAGEKARITNSGNFGVGTPAPKGKLDVNGSFYVGNEGIYDRVDGEINIKGDLLVEGGKVTGMSSVFLSLGEIPDVITFTAGGLERLRIHSNGFVGIGLDAPTANLHVSGDIRSNAGVRGGSVSVGAYAGDWTGSSNEVRAQSNTHLLLQQTNPYNVGIGTDTPREKLHVRGSVRSDYGIIAATAAFSGAVRVSGNFTAIGDNTQVYLTSTTVYGNSRINGDLTVTGSIGSVAGVPAYKASTQTFSGTNTFLGQVTVSSDVASSNRLGAGVLDFDFPGSKYLQVGDDQSAFPNDNAMAYLVGGAAANAKLNFYRGPLEAARLETQDGFNLALVINNQAKTLTDATYHRIQNSVVWISTGYAGTPAIFVSSASAIVGMGTTVSDPNWRLTVDGNVRIAGSGNKIFFPDGTSLGSGSSGALSVGNVSNNSDAVVQSDADQVSGGDVILRAGAVDGLVLKSGGNIGIGTINPVAKLNIRGGDLVLGTPVNPYSGDSVEDLVVGGNIAFDGELLQRSLVPVRLSALIVAGDVYLSTGTGKKTGVGTDNPLQRLQVAGDINIESAFGLRINNTAPAGQYLRGNGTRFESSQIVAAELPGTIVRTTETIATTLPLAGGGDLSANRTFSLGGLTSLGTGNYVVGVNAGGGAWEYKGIVGVANETDVTHAAGQITIGLIDPLIVAKGGTGTATLAANGVLYGNDTGAVNVTAAGTQYQVLRAGIGGVPAFGTIDLDQAAAVTGILPVVYGGTGGLLPAANGGTGANLGAGAIGAVPYFSGTGVMAALGAGTANYLLQANGAAAPSWVLSTNANLGNTIIRRDGSGGFSAGIITASEFVGNISGRARSLENTVGNNDYIRIRGDDTGFNAGYLEIATADDGNEPIYVRQYSDYFATVARTATLLDGLGNTSFPGSVTAGLYSYAQYFNMNANAVASNPEYLVGEWGGDKFLRYIAPASVTVGNATNADTTDGLHAAAATVAPGVNQLVRTDGTGYTYLGWLNTVSGDNGATAITRVFASSDQFLRYYTLPNFTSQIQSAASGTWGINITGNAGAVTGGVYTTTNQTIGGTKTFSSTISGSVSGNAGTATALASAPSVCSGVNFARGIAASGNASCAQPSDVSGNAGSATKLATARNINGVPFNGTIDITVADGTKVPTGTKVNGHPLSNDVDVTAGDLGLGSGISTTIIVRDKNGANCNITVTNGVITGTNCP